MNHSNTMSNVANIKQIFHNLKTSRNQQQTNFLMVKLDSKGWKRFLLLRITKLEISTSKDTPNRLQNYNHNADFGTFHLGQSSPLLSETTLSSQVSRLKFKRYNAESDPIVLLYHSEQYFKLYKTLEKNKVPMVAYHLDDEAQLQYQLFKKENLIITWNDFEDEILSTYSS